MDLLESKGSCAQISRSSHESFDLLDDTCLGCDACCLITDEVTHIPRYAILQSNICIKTLLIIIK